MTCLLSPESEFEGGDLELMSEGKIAKIKQGHAVFFASFIRHRVTPVIRGKRNSLVMWFGGNIVLSSDSLMSPQEFMTYLIVFSHNLPSLISKRLRT